MCFQNLFAWARTKVCDRDHIALVSLVKGGVLDSKTKQRLWMTCFGRDISSNTSSLLARSSQTVELFKEESIVDQNDPSKSIFVIVSGQLKAVRFSKNGHEIWLSDFKAGELVGELSALTQRRRSSTLIAEEATTVLRLPYATLDIAMNSDGNLSLSIAKIVAERLIATSDQLADLMVSSVTARLYNEMLKLGARTEHDEELFRLDRDITVTKLSERVHASREATSRAFSTLEHRGLAKRTSSGFEVVSPVYLKDDC